MASICYGAGMPWWGTSLQSDGDALLIIRLTLPLRRRHSGAHIPTLARPRPCSRR